MKQPPTPTQNSSAPSRDRPRRRWPRRLAVLAVVLLAAAVALLALAPTIASLLAPGLIERGSGERVQGKVRVKKVSLGWFSPTAVDGLEVLDPAGATVLTADGSVPLSLWKLVTGGALSGGSIDLGEARLNAKLDLVRELDGSTNLERALSPKTAVSPVQPPTASPRGAPGGQTSARSIKGSFRIQTVEAVMRARLDGGGLGPPQGVRALAGLAEFNLDGQAGTILASADLAGEPVPAALASGSAAEKFTAKLNAKADLPRPGRSLAESRADVYLTIDNAPLTLADALGGLNGLVSEGVGGSADVTLNAAGTLENATAGLSFTATGMQAELGAALRAGRLDLGGLAATPTGGVDPSKPGRLVVRSTDFLARLPGAAAGLAEATKQVQLDKAPGLDLLLEKFSLPVPPGLLDGSAAPADALAEADLRRAGLIARVRLPAISGRVALAAPGAAGGNQGGGGGGGGPTSGSVQSLWRPFSTEPLDVVLSIPDLSGEASVKGATKATLDGRDAGRLEIDASATGLLDERGRARALARGADGRGPGLGGLASALSAQISVAGASTALLQPLLTSAQAPLDLRLDVGPTLDLALAVRTGPQAAAVQATAVQASATTGGERGLAALPPAELSARVDSSNLTLRAAVRLEGGVVSAPGDAVTLTMNSATPLAARLLAGGQGTPAGGPPPARLDGPGKLTLSAADIRINLDRLASDAPPAAGERTIPEATARVSLRIDDLSVTPLFVAEQAAGSPTAPPAPPAEPIRITSLTLGAAVAPGAAPAIEVNGAMTHSQRPFALTGRMTLDGLASGVLPAGEGALAMPLGLKPAGTIALTDLPTTLLATLPGLSVLLSDPAVIDAGGPAPSPVPAIVRGLIGRDADLSIELRPADTALIARANLATEAGGLGLSASAKATRDAAELLSLEAFAAVVPEQINPALVRLTASGASPTIDAPARLTIKSAAQVIVPLDPPTASPQFARAGDLQLALALDSGLIVSNLDNDGTKGSGTSSVEVRSLSGEVVAPLSGLAEGAAKSKRATVRLAGNLLGAPDGRPRALLADLSVRAEAAMDGGTPDAEVRLAKAAPADLDATLGLGGALADALGDTADLTVRVKPLAGSGAAGADAPLVLSADIAATRLSGANIAFTKSADRVTLNAPAAITWRPGPAFVNALLAPPADATQGTQLSVVEISPITLNLAALSVAIPQSTPDGVPAVGPLKPGVFDLDLAINTDTLAVNVTPPSPAPRSAASGSGKPGDPLAQIGQEIGKLLNNQPQVSGTQSAEPGAQLVTLSGVRATISSRPPANTPPPPSGQLRLSAAIERVSGAEAGGPLGKSSLSAVISGIADGRGVPTTDQAVIDLDADVAGFPTGVLDLLANQRGLLLTALGPTVTLKATGRNLSANASPSAPARPRGSLDAVATSPRATAKLRGDVRDGVFVQSGPVEARLIEVRQELVEQLAGGLPLVSTLQKLPSDEPGLLIAEGLTAPLDNDLSKLNGRLSVDLGVAQFTTKDALGKLIKGLGGQKAGAIGRKLEPFVVTFASGVGTYERFRLPIGEFTLETRGTVDLVQRRINVVTYVPLLAITDEAAGLLNTGLAGKLGVLDRATLVPITTSGPMDDPETKLDIELFAKEAGDSLLKQPGKIIENVIGDLLKPKKKDP